MFAAIIFSLCGEKMESILLSRIKTNGCDQVINVIQCYIIKRNRIVKSSFYDICLIFVKFTNCCKSSLMIYAYLSI